MKSNKMIKDFGMVLSSNALILISNILTGLVIPKLLGVTNYGYYKIFTLYLGYTALLHFGFVDGILLLHGGDDYEELNKYKFRRNTKVFALLQIIVSCLIVIVAFFFMRGIYRFIFVMLGFDTITTNMTSYYQYVSQCTRRFKELSTRKVYQAGLKIICTAAFFMLHIFKFIDDLSAYIYISCIVGIDIVLLLWYVYTYKDITFGKSEKFIANSKEIFNYFKQGIILTVAFQVANLIFNLDRQFVSILYNTKTYAVYSFAYSLISMATTVIGAVSLVLFPNLKRKTKDKVIDDFSNNMSIISVLVFAAHIGYYPLCIFIKWFLPEYDSSLVYLKIIFPGLAISSCISAIIFTYYKVLDENKRYFKICCIILVLSALFNWIAHLIFHTASAISWASIITLLLWYIIGESYFIRTYHIKWVKNLLYIIIMMMIFYIITFSTLNEVIATCIYILLFVVVTYVIYKELIMISLKRLKK